jgi:hypothetical protein
MEAVLLLAGLTSINLAAIVLLDLLTGPTSWGRKAGWAVLVIGLPLVGAVLCYWRGPAGGSGHKPRRVSPHAASGRSATEAAGAASRAGVEPGS